VVGGVAAVVLPLVHPPAARQAEAEGVVVDVLVRHVVGADALWLDLDGLGDGVADAEVAGGEVVAPHLEHLVMNQDSFIVSS